MVKKQSDDIKLLELIKQYGNDPNKTDEENEDIVLNKIYPEVKTFRQLKIANIAYLKGDLYCTPYHLGPLDEEMHPLRNDLILLNKNGFINVYGEPFEEWNKMEDGEMLQSHSKSCIDGYVNKKFKKKLIDILTNNQDFLYLIQEDVDGVNLVQHNFPSNECILSRGREGAPETVNEMPWSTFSSVHVDTFTDNKHEVGESFENYPELAQLFKKSMIFVVVIYNKWPDEVTEPQHVEKTLLKLFS